MDLKGSEKIKKRVLLFPFKSENRQKDKYTDNRHDKPSDSTRRQKHIRKTKTRDDALERHRHKHCYF